MKLQLLVETALITASVGIGSSQSALFNFDNDAVGKPPTGFTSYATGGGPAGKWLVKEMSDSPSGKHVVEQTDADSTDTHFPVLIAAKGEEEDLDVSVKVEALSWKGDSTEEQVQIRKKSRRKKQKTHTAWDLFLGGGLQLARASSPAGEGGSTLGKPGQTAAAG